MAQEKTALVSYLRGDSSQPWGSWERRGLPGASALASTKPLLLFHTKDTSAV